VLNDVPRHPAIIVATPGAEPIADGGYTAALLLDAAAAGGEAALDAGTRTLHRWLAAAHLVRPAHAGGQVLLVGDGPPGPTAALVRFDPAGFAARELAERLELGLPPAVRVAVVTGDRAAVDLLVGRVALATPDAVLGPVEVTPPPPASRALPDDIGGPLFDAPPIRLIIRVDAASGLTLAQQLRVSLAVRSAKREPGRVRVQLDVADLTQ
jgi:primosomal protein N' (replication factor Y)